MSRQIWMAAIVIAALLTGCRGSDDTDISEPQFPVTEDPDAFAAFLNQTPAVPRDGAEVGEIDNVEDFPEAYYNTIDPDGSRDTFDKWLFENGFTNADGSDATCNPANCRQTHVKFRDTKDLGYGRNMFLRWNTATNDVAVYVENFQVDAVPGLPYGPLNFEALVNDERQWNFGVNAIEFSAYPDTNSSARKFTKFYNFAGDGIRANDPSGTLQHFVDLDGRGEKPMPNTCIVCHGGRGRTLVVPGVDGRNRLAPTVVGGIPGDVMAQLQIIEFDTLQFADEPGFTPEENAEGIRLINEAVMATYEHRAENFQGSGDWSPVFAMELLDGRYGGDVSVVNEIYNAAFVPDDWNADQNLYQSLAGPNCLVCHALRGTNVNTSVAFPTLSNLQEYDQAIDHLVFEQGKMPLGLLNYSNFWDSEDKNPASMAAALGLTGRIAADNTAVAPGSPVAVIVAPLGAALNASDEQSLDIPISGAGSAFATADGHRWEVQPSATATIVSAGPQGDAVLRVTAAANYTLTLTVTGMDGAENSTSQRISVEQDATGEVANDVTFFGAGGILEMIEAANCTDCHAADNPFNLSSMPIYFTACNSPEFNGHEFLYRSVLARVNFDAPLDSLIIRKPSNGATDPTDRANSGINGYHNGGLALPSDSDYSRLLSWILNGAAAGAIPSADSIPVDAISCTP